LVIFYCAVHAEVDYFNLCKVYSCLITFTYTHACANYFSFRCHGFNEALWKTKVNLFVIVPWVKRMVLHLQCPCVLKYHVYLQIHKLLVCRQIHKLLVCRFWWLIVSENFLCQVQRDLILQKALHFSIILRSFADSPR
jgi:hypothetical protein